MVKINLFHYIGIGLLLALSYAAVVIYAKKELLRNLIVLSAFWLVFAGGAWMYFSNSKVRVYVNTFVNPCSAHEVLGGGELPLPPKTALSFRSSEGSAMYFSRLPVAKVYDYYRTQPEITIQSVPPADSGEKKLEVLHKNVLYMVSVSPAGKYSSRIFIEAVP